MRRRTHPVPVAAPDRRVWLGAALVVAAVIGVYANTLDAPFVFDDRAAILGNETIRSLLPLPGPLAPPPGGSTVSGRPLVNVSLAINYAVGGIDPRSYHAVNIGLHALAALLLFGVVRRTAAGRSGDGPPDGRSKPGWSGASGLALAAALVWALHPLQTAAVSYVVQRAEILAGLFGLLTLYGVIRAAGSVSNTRGWSAVAIAASLAAAASKETAAAMPLVVLLYDRVFLAGSFSAALRRRAAIYGGLAASWLVTLALVVSSNARGGTVGAAGDISPWTYLLTQAEAIVHYLRLVIWPAPLVFDYGTAVVGGPAEVLPELVLVLALAAATGLAWARGRTVAGFLSAAFFVLLAPSSSIVPIASQTMAEHRMYLPSAAVIVALVCGLRYCGRRRSVAVAIVAAAALTAGTATVSRNQDYRSEVALWRDTVAKRPDNPRAHANLGAALLDAGLTDDAIAVLRAATERWPDESTFHASLCLAFLKAGRLPEALAAGERAVALDPRSVEARVQLANACQQSGQGDRAIEHARAALALYPGDDDVRALLVEALVQRARTAARRGATAEGVADAAEAVQLAPTRAEVWFTLGNARAADRDLTGAVEAYRRALEIEPAHVGARNNLANALLVLGRLEESIAEYEQVLRARPDDASVRANLREARALFEKRRPRP